MATRREKRRLWTPEEDQKLRVVISLRNIHLESINDDHPSWKGIAAQAELDRTDKSCWERWKNHLKPDVRKANFSQEEDDTIIHLHWVYGNKWATIAENPLLRGRSPNAIKNRWNNHLKKRLEIMSDLQRLLLYANLLLLRDDETNHSVLEVDTLSLTADYASLIPQTLPSDPQEMVNAFSHAKFPRGNEISMAGDVINSNETIFEGDDSANWNSGLDLASVENLMPTEEVIKHWEH